MIKKQKGFSFSDFLSCIFLAIPGALIGAVLGAVIALIFGIDAARAAMGCAAVGGGGMFVLMLFVTGSADTSGATEKPKESEEHNDRFLGGIVGAAIGGGIGGVIGALCGGGEAYYWAIFLAVVFGVVCLSAD
ncbi:MAG: hypothetical protein SPL25_00030 [Succinivibrionaceae bacterium]|nr:hypothetical protein [Succinivibrionaceae bacterium]